MYKSVVTADLSRFLPPVFTKSRWESLALTEHIYIEYEEEDFSIPYDVLMEKGQWGIVGLTADRNEAFSMMRWTDEVRRLSETLVRHLKFEAALEVFPRLKTVAVCSIYGPQADKWRRYSKQRDDLDRCRAGWDRFLSVYKVQQCCYWGNGGPLGMPTLTAEPPRTDAHHPLAIQHISSPVDRDELRTPPGAPVRWVAAMGAAQSWQEAYYDLGAELHRKAMQRSRMEEFLGNAAYLIQADVYCSSSVLGQTNGDLVRPLLEVAGEKGISLYPDASVSVDVQRALAAKLGPEMHDWMRDDGCDEFPDEVRWHASCDTPVCEACGWHPVSTEDEPWYGSSGEKVPWMMETEEGKKRAAVEAAKWQREEP